MGTGALSLQGRETDPYLPLVSRLGISEPTPLLPLYAFMTDTWTLPLPLPFP